MEVIRAALNNLLDYCEHEQYKGYDPYDTLNSCINFRAFGKWGPPLAIQFQKLNPLNIRPLLGIKKGINPKAMGLFLKAYCMLHKKTGRQEYITKAEEIFHWLKANYSTGYTGYAWGYNFDWATPGSYLNAYTPSVVVTSFIVDGIFEYYKITKSVDAKDTIINASKYIINDIPTTSFENGISFSYTHLSKGSCYNASLLAAEVLAKADFVENSKNHTQLIESAIRFVLSKQNDDGSWYYSLDPKTNIERKQIDFHQGFVLVSLIKLMNLTGLLRDKINVSISKGANFYRFHQFDDNGRSLWRLPKKWPVDIHNQSQGIITFNLLKEIDPSYSDFAKKIAIWSILNMKNSNGTFQYRKYPFYKIKISYMRWSQAWMMLALSEIIDFAHDKYNPRCCNN